MPTQMAYEKTLLLEGSKAKGGEEKAVYLMACQANKQSTIRKAGQSMNIHPPDRCREIPILVI